MNQNNILQIIAQKNNFYHPLLSKYNKTLSIGSTCFIKKFMLSIGINQETEYFDYIGTPVWAMTDLIQNNKLDKIFNYNDYKNIKILCDKEDSYNITHIPHFLIFKHDFAQTHKQLTKPLSFLQFNDFKTKYTRRALRFYDLLNNNSSILFIRYEQYKNYIIHDMYKDKYEKDELTQLREFSIMLKEKYPNLTFNIIFFYSNIENSFYDNNYNILVLKNNKSLTYDNCHEKLHEICTENSDLLNNFL
jgi:hypothetical protein